VPILGQKDSDKHSVIHASHTFHEIQMYYPMRVLRDREFKIIWNIAHQLPYPFASDLWAASTWQAQLAKGKDAPYGLKTVDQYVNRPAFELYHIAQDPHESRNLALEPEYANILRQYQGKLQAFQKEMEDPWILKWTYE
jgi:N-sulfoglucosamine sulfohydrolase